MLGLSKKDRNLMTETELSNITIMQKLNSVLLERKTGKDARNKHLKLQAEVLTK